MPKRLAVCIGVNEYRNRPSANLRFARHDAESVAALLADKAGGGFDHVVMVLDEQATKGNIIESLRAVLLDPYLTNDDLVVMYFAGHGALDKGDNIFLVPHDVDFLADNSVDVTTTLHIGDLEVLLDNTQAGYVLLLLDACHSGASGKLLGRIKYRDSSNIILVGAARYSEKAWETPEFSHGRFTELLLSSASERPSLGEWITLQQMLSFIQREMQNIGADQVMEVSTHTIDQNVPIFKNPAYSLISDELLHQVKGLCGMSGCTILAGQPGRTYPGVFTMRESKSFGRHDDTMIMCLDNSVLDVGKAQIEQFNALFRFLQVEARVTSGMLVTRSELSVPLKESLNRAVTAQTVDELQRNLINFDGYLEQLVRGFTQVDPDRIGEPPLSKYYVELDAKRRKTAIELLKDVALEDVLERTNELAQEKGVQVQTPITIEKLKALFRNSHLMPLLSSVLGLQTAEEPDSITELTRQWLSANDTQAAIILGGYGTGKTTFARKVACDLAQTYQSTIDKSGLRIPILIPLRRFPKVTAVDIEAAIIAHLKQQCGVANPDFTAFREMNRAGLFVLIFDGFDEMAVQATSEVIRRNFYEIMQFATEPKAKVFITSRPEAFLSEMEELEVLSPDSDILPESYPLLLHIELCPLSLNQIEMFLQQRVPLIKRAVEQGKDWKYYLDQINSVMGLRELAQRPVLLEMTIRTLPRLIEQGGIVTRPRLYETYLVSEIERQQILKGRSFLITDKERRLHLAELVARYLHMKKRAELTADQIQDVLRAEFTPEQRISLESYIRDFIACSFMVREGDQYRFSHLSFMEYLVAKSLVQEIETNRPHILKDIQLTSGVLGFLIELEPSSDSSWREILWSWIRSTTGQDKEEAGHLGANAITILNYTGESFRDADLEGTILRGADLHGAQCIDARFRRSNLEYSDLTGADLTGADFREANLTDVKLYSVVRENEVLEGEALEEYLRSSPHFAGANLGSSRKFRLWFLRQFLSSAEGSLDDGQGNVTVEMDTRTYDVILLHKDDQYLLADDFISSLVGLNEEERRLVNLVLQAAIQLNMRYSKKRRGRGVANRAHPRRSGTGRG